MASHTANRSARPTRYRSRLRRVRLVVALVVLVATGAVIWMVLPGSAATSATSKHASTTGAVALDPSAFSKGSCVALAPTKGNRHETVFLDAGHGGIDPGAAGTTETGATIYEADETLPVELDAASLLRADGYRVVVSRTTNSSVVKLTAADRSGSELSLQGAHDDVAARDVCANLSGAKALIGIYFDAGGSTSNAGSLTTYDADRPFAAANVQLATLVQNDVLSSLNANGWSIPNAGVVSDATVGSLVPTDQASPLADAAANYGHVLLLGPAMAGYFTTPSQMPGALVEPLFITDPFEGSIASSSSGQAAIAQGIAQAVLQFLPPTAAVSPTGKGATSTASAS
jgi:N-acetylmuramoyl-L-alanine amidase